LSLFETDERRGQKEEDYHLERGKIDAVKAGEDVYLGGVFQSTVLDGLEWTVGFCSVLISVDFYSGFRRSENNYRPTWNVRLDS